MVASCFSKSIESSDNSRIVVVIVVMVVEKVLVAVQVIATSSSDTIINSNSICKCSSSRSSIGDSSRSLGSSCNSRGVVV